MRRIALIAIVLPFALAGCLVPLGDRVLQVKANVVSETGRPLQGCVLGLHSAANDQAIEVKANVHPEFLTSFINPPRRGAYYFKITCPGHSGFYRSGNNDFASPPYFHDLGRVVIRG